jgi:hypothetical protein
MVGGADEQMKGVGRTSGTSNIRNVERGEVDTVGDI